MDDTQKILTAIAIIAQVGAQHLEDREMIRQLTARIKQLADERDEKLMAKPVAVERGVPE